MATQRVQKNLTVMFTDISGFTKHTETISREALMSRLDTHNELLMPIVAHFEGKIVKTIGDAFLITFDSPTNAVQCGLFMQHTLRKYNVEKPEGEQIHIKVSINSGEVTVTDNDVFGDPVNVAAKIEKATNPDEIYFTESVFLSMNKAEVPTSFVKTFRPKGTDSTEIKLYKVAMDEDDARYQKVIAATNIDKEKIKTRVLELSNLAEKEFVRYQDALDALVESQGKSSRGMIIAVVAAALIMAVAVIIAVSMLGGGEGPHEQLARDVRAYLQNDKPGEARGRVETYIAEHGADDSTSQLLNEIRDFEIGRVVAEADRLIQSGRPENARTAIQEYFGNRELTDSARAAMDRVDGYLQARTLIRDGKAAETIQALTAAFGDSNPSDEIRRLRDQAEALTRAGRLMKAGERFDEPMLMYGAIIGAFGMDTDNAHALEFIEVALANELYRDAKVNGYAVASANYEEYRKRVPNLASWSWVQTHMKMGGIWHMRTDPKNRHARESQEYWDMWRDVRDYVENKPDKLYRFGCLNFMLARVNFLAVCDGAEQWRLAIEADPSLPERHEELMTAYRAKLSGDRADLGRNLKTDVKYMLGCFTSGLTHMRELVKKLYYNELLDDLVRYASSTESDDSTRRMNAVAILTETGDTERIPDRFYVFREHLADFVSSGRLERFHSNALFTAPMTYDEYREFRGLIDHTLQETAERKGKFGSYSSALGILQDMLSDLRQAQPQHTAQYDGE
jgi:class 3 adenylate cyclase